MKKMKHLMKTFWNDESGQGMAEYVLLIVVVLGVAFVFKNKIKEMVTNKLEEVSGKMGSFNAD